MNTPTSDRFKQITRLVIFTIAGGLILYFILSKLFDASDGSIIQRTTSALFPFMLGAFIAFLLKPICNKLDIWFGDFAVRRIFRRRIAAGKTTEKRVRRRAELLSIGVAMVLLVSVIVGLVWLVVPSLKRSIVNLRNDLPTYIATLTSWFESLNTPDNAFGQIIYSVYADIIERFSGEGNSFLDSLINNLSGIITTAGTLISTVVDFLVGFLVTTVSSVYILMNRKRFAAQATLMAHAIFKRSSAEWVINEVKFANRKFSEFLTGKMVDSFIVGVILFILFTIFKIPQAPLIAVFMAFCNMIPFFGPFIGAIPCAFIVLMASIDNPFKVVIYLIIVLAIQQLDGNILDPFIVGDNIGLSSFWVLFAVILFGDLFGFFGMLLGVPIFAVLYDIVRQLINFGLKKRGEEQLLTNYNFIYHDPEEERAALKKRAAAIKAARKEARMKDAAEREEAMERELAIAQAAAAARAEAEAEALARAEADAETLARAEAEAEANADTLTHAEADAADDAEDASGADSNT